ncbi:MAG: glutamate-cysteine ligase family protein [Candidatus Thiodiazotropha sp. L084R]
MGQEIYSSNFSESDFAEFERRLISETLLLEGWFMDGQIGDQGQVGGLELEACILDSQGDPAPLNQVLLQGLDDRFVVPELATFNLEINTTPRTLRQDALHKMYQELQDVWQACNLEAEKFSAQMGMVGILPTLRQTDLSLENMSPLNRYRALNDQVFKLRRGLPVELHIDGSESLDLCHDDVMLESAATSFQIHLQVAASQAAKLYNLSKIVSAPMVALSANSPYLFGRNLWDETRIPLFEQSISVGASDLTKRVSFGIRYLYQSMMESFRANLQRYPVLLPRLMDEPLEKLAHLRLHNGTIWRWNRPLIGFDEHDRAHLRIEHRVVSAGPSMTDMIANAAFYFGLVTGLAERYERPEAEMGFIRARSNFYQAARYGLRSHLYWFGWQSLPAGQLISEQLLPISRQGLLSLGIDSESVDHWLEIIRQRVTLGVNGAIWQKQWVAKYGLDMRGLTKAYLERQESGKPVHEWDI